MLNGSREHYETAPFEAAAECARLYFVTVVVVIWIVWLLWLSSALVDAGFDLNIEVIYFHLFYSFITPKCCMCLMLPVPIHHSNM